MASRKAKGYPRVSTKQHVTITVKGGDPLMATVIEFYDPQTDKGGIIQIHPAVELDKLYVDVMRADKGVVTRKGNREP